MSKVCCKFIFSLFVFLFLWVTTGFSDAGAVLITHAGSSVSSLRAEEVKNIFSGKIIDIGGAKVVLVMKNNSDVGEQFFRQYLNKTSVQFLNFWKIQVFAGNGKLPKMLDTESDLLSFVSSNPGSLACVSSENYDANKDKVKKIAIN